MGYWQILLLILFSIVVEESLSWFFKGELKIYPFSAVTTSIGIMLMIYSSYIWIYLALILLSLSQKYLIKIKNHHIFNPSNFAVLMMLLLFSSYGGISGGSLGHNQYLLYLVLLLGFIILIRVNRWIIPLGFIIFYTLFELLFIDSSTILIDDFFDKFYMVSFIVFALFMLTDPLTTPQNPIYQAIFAILLALFSTLFDIFYGLRVEHIFLSLSLLSPIGALCWHRDLRATIFVEIVLIFTIFFILSKTTIYIGSPY